MVKQRETLLVRMFVIDIEAYGWNTILVEDGADVEAVNVAIEKAKQSDKPTLVEVKTIVEQGLQINKELMVYMVHRWEKKKQLYSEKKLVGIMNHLKYQKEVYADFKVNVTDRGGTARIMNGKNYIMNIRKIPRVSC